MRSLDRHQKVQKSEIEEHLKMFFFPLSLSGSAGGSWSWIEDEAG